MRDALDIRHHVEIGHAHRAISPRQQEIVAQPVLGTVMSVTINLDDQCLGRAEKVGDERRQHGLAAELAA